MPGKYTLPQAKRKLASQGRFGDTELEHVNPYEKYLLKKLGASRTTNPKTGLTENWNIVKTIQSAYDRNVKPVAKHYEEQAKDVGSHWQKQYHEGLPQGATGENLHRGVKSTVDATGGFVTGMGRAVVGGAMQILTGKNPYDNQGSSDTDTSGSSVTGGQSYKGFGAVKRRKKKKKMIGGQGEGTETSIATAGKRGSIVTPGRNKKSGLSIPSRGSGLSGTSPSYGLG
tara:strand:- start:6680 stop:7363 length:684 start_codon:yes stop_codon:yes gene_type:complete